MAPALLLEPVDKLVVFLKDGWAGQQQERKPFVIGRKNWLFSNTPRGAKTSTTICIIIETAKENGLNLRYFVS